MGDSFNYDPWEHWELVKLNLNNQDVRKHLLEAVRMWIEDFDIDGLRLNVAYLLDRNFIDEIRKTAEALKSDFFLLGEVIHGDYREGLGNGRLHSQYNQL